MLKVSLTKRKPLHICAGIYLQGETNCNLIKKEIMCNGPVLSRILVTEEFKKWTKDLTLPYEDVFPVFIPTTPTSPRPPNTSPHAIVITGWGNLYGVEYWEVRNTYGTKFGINGYMWIAVSTLASQGYWIGPDIPDYDPVLNRYDCAPYFITPEDIPNMDELIENGIFKKV